MHLLHMRRPQKTCSLSMSPRRILADEEPGKGDVNPPNTRARWKEPLCSSRPYGFAAVNYLSLTLKLSLDPWITCYFRLLHQYCRHGSARVHKATLQWVPRSNLGRDLTGWGHSTHSNSRPR